MNVSIIIPVYNVAEYLEGCIMSIINQTYDKIEILLIDDGSSDGSSSLCDTLAKKDNRIKSFHKNNGGVSSARNFGIDRSKGNFLVFIDADDQIAPMMIEILVDSLVKNKCQMSSCSLTQINHQVKPNKIIVSDNTVSIFTAENALESILYQKNISNGIHGKLYAKCLFANIRFSENLTIAEDLEVNYSILKNIDKVAINSGQLYYYLQRENSAMNANYKPSRMQGLSVLNKIHQDIAIENANMLTAANNRLFMEAIYIAQTIPSEHLEHKTDYGKCINLIKVLSSQVIKDKKSQFKYRLYAAIALLDADLLVSLLRHKKRNLITRTAI